MKKGLSILFAIGSILLILDVAQVGSAFMMFLLLGIIPGTGVAVSPTLMLQLISLISGFTLARIVSAWMGALFAKSTLLRHA